MSPRSEQQFEEMRNRSRRAILKAALKLFSQKGFSETTAEDIARKVGISKGLIYNYFSSKEDILEHLIDEFVERIVPPISTFAEGENPAIYLEELIHRWFSEVRNNPDLIKIGVQFHTDSALKRVFRKKVRTLEEQYAGFFSDVLRRLGSPDPDVESLILGAILDGVGLNYAAAPDVFPLDRVENRLIRLYCGDERNSR
jgi:AcrR family transcriptional regulator